MNFHSRIACCLCAVVFALPLAGSQATALDDLKKLEITCFVPSYLPNGFKLKKVEITYDDLGPDENGQSHKVPLYGIEWVDGKRTFSIDSAAEGIGDRNIMEEEDTEDTELKTSLGPMYLIYRRSEERRVGKECSAGRWGFE